MEHGAHVVVAGDADDKLRVGGLQLGQDGGEVADLALHIALGEDHFAAQQRNLLVEDVAEHNAGVVLQVDDGDFLGAQLVHGHIRQPFILGVVGVLQAEQVVVCGGYVGVTGGRRHLNHSGLLVDGGACQDAGAVVAADFGNILGVGGDHLCDVGGFLGGALVIVVVNLDHFAVDAAGFVDFGGLHVQRFLEEVAVLRIIAREGSAAGNVVLIFSGCPGRG